MDFHAVGRLVLPSGYAIHEETYRPAGLSSPAGAQSMMLGALVRSSDYLQARDVAANLPKRSMPYSRIATRWSRRHADPCRAHGF